jgi:Ohr subfamily peroxiredoxin
MTAAEGSVRRTLERPTPKLESPTLGVLYSSTAVATGGLIEGRVRTTDGALDMVLEKPKELGGSGGGPGNNPMQFLAAGYSASFLAALVAADTREAPKIPPDVSVQATVAFGLRPDGGFGLLATVEVSLPGVSRVDGERLMKLAGHICSVCDATREEVFRCKLV